MMGSWHELDTTTSFVMYYIYNNGLREGKLKPSSPVLLLSCPAKLISLTQYITIIGV